MYIAQLIFILFIFIFVQQLTIHIFEVPLRICPLVFLLMLVYILYSVHRLHFYAHFNHFSCKLTKRCSSSDSLSTGLAGFWVDIQNEPGKVAHQQEHNMSKLQL